MAAAGFAEDGKPPARVPLSRYMRVMEAKVNASESTTPCLWDWLPRVRCHALRDGCICFCHALPGGCRFWSGAA